MISKFNIKTRLSKLHTCLIARNRHITIGRGSIVYYKSLITFKSISYNELNKEVGIKIGTNCRIGMSPDNYHAGMPFYTSILCDGEGGYVTIGNNCRLNGVYIHAQAGIEIGDNCVMASGVNIIDSNGHETKSLNRTKGRDIPKKIIIGDNVWIGLNAIILKGSVIGDNAIISAGSVVRGTVPENSIYTTQENAIIKTIDF